MGLAGHHIPQLPYPAAMSPAKGPPPGAPRPSFPGPLGEPAGLRAGLGGLSLTFPPASIWKEGVRPFLVLLLLLLLLLLLH